ncbi:MAG: hypothetical protein AAFR47_23975, partial [Pseudomonadota bacterium]
HFLEELDWYTFGLRDAVDINICGEAILHAPRHEVGFHLCDPGLIVHRILHFFDAHGVVRGRAWRDRIALPALRQR